MNLIDKTKIPEYVTHVTEILEKTARPDDPFGQGFDAFLIGGCVRDLILNKNPKDWDIATNAKPEEIIPLFEKTIYENKFGTVGVCIPKMSKLGIETNVSGETKYNIVEVTTYRTESKYDDFRHPSEIKFSDNLEDDLKRRDFTINAIAYNISKGHIKDIFNGLKDIKDKVIRAVNTPDERFTEDPLRMLRAIRFSTQLNFTISHETLESIQKNASLINKISKERIRDEFVKIIESPLSAVGIGLLSKLGLLKYIIPELEKGINCQQGGAHSLDVFEHNLKALEHATDKKLGLEIRLASLFHDIGKPSCRRRGIKKEFTFYGHEVIGAKMVQKIMENLKFPKKTTDFVVLMVRNHMFFSDTEKISLSAVRRIIKKVSELSPEILEKEEGHPIWDLMRVREADRVGMRKKEAPYRLRKYHAMIEEVLHDPISVGQLAIDGKYLMEMKLHPPTEDGQTGIKPGPRMGWILNALLEEVLDDSTKNTKEHLTELVKSLDMLGDNELKTLGERGKIKKEELEEQEIKRLHNKHGV